MKKLGILALVMVLLTIGYAYRALTGYLRRARWTSVLQARGT